MPNDNELIQRLGFEAWADNIIVNLIEDYGEKLETDSYNIRIEKYPTETSYIVSAYVAGRGWLTHTRTIKKKEAQS